MSQQLFILFTSVPQLPCVKKCQIYIKMSPELCFFLHLFHPKWGISKNLTVSNRNADSILVYLIQLRETWQKNYQKN